MEIAEIKSRLTLANLLSYYSLKPDKNLRLHCPSMMIKHPACRCITKHIQHIVLAAIAKPMARAWM
ncbi:MAG: hypothetical protein IPJ81_08380 [Chitinophagaceae bacterium]|nr:hypothetical protein [Chitinophagaceae bacterium]